MDKKPSYKELEKKIQILEENEKKYSSILNAFNDGVYLCSADYEIQYLNPAMAKKIGYDATNEKCHKAIYNLKKPCPWCYFDKIKAGENHISVEIESNKLHYRIESILLETKSKLTVYHDITEQKKAEKQQHKRIKELNGLYSFLKVANTNVNLKELLAKLNSEIIPQSMQFTDKVFSEIEINGYIYSDCENISDKTEHYLKSDINFKKEKIGELRIGYTDEKIKFLEKYEQTLTNAYAVALGNIIENHSFYEKLINAKEKAEQDQKIIIESEEKYRSLFENIMSSFSLHKIVLDEKNNPVDYIFIEINKMFETMTGLKKENIVNKKVTKVLPGIEKDPANWINKYGKVALTGKEIRFEQFSEQLKKWYSVLAFSPKKGYFATIFNDITEKKEMDKALSNATIKTEEKERARFAKELHDGLGPLFSTVKLYFQWLTETKDPEKRKFIIEKGNENIEEAITMLSEISNNLNPHILVNYGLTEAIQIFIDKLLHNKSITFNFQTKLNERFPEEIEITLYRVTTELINNTLKYAKATEVTIKLTKKDNNLMLCYFDNGKGFDVDSMVGKNSGLGLFNIKNRVQHIGGDISILSKPNKGVEVKIKVKL